MKTLLSTDVGGVLKEHKRYDGDVRWIPCSEWALRKLCKFHKMHIISHVRPENKSSLKRMLRKSFVPKYIPEKRWHFTYTREAKVDVMKKYGIPTHIDDRPDIIEWVKKAGLEGILFRGTNFPNWWSVVDYLTNQDCNH